MTGSTVGPGEHLAGGELFIPAGIRLSQLCRGQGAEGGEQRVGCRGWGAERGSRGWGTEGGKWGCTSPPTLWGFAQAGTYQQGGPLQSCFSPDGTHELGLQQTQLNTPYICTHSCYIYTSAQWMQKHHKYTQKCAHFHIQVCT